MDDKLRGLIVKHAANQGISEQDAIKIYTSYNSRINTIVDELDNNNISEIRVPHLMRFIFNFKKYEKVKQAREAKRAAEATEN
jgi:hypothetical protein